MTHLRDVVMAAFGLSHTVNTIASEPFLVFVDCFQLTSPKVGNDFVRGVSGGERKRVSIAEV